MKVLALDLANDTGWATADSDTYELMPSLQANVTKPPQPASGVQHFRHKFRGGFFDQYHRWLWWTINDHAVDIVYYEQPYVDAKSSHAAISVLFGMVAVTEQTTFGLGIRVFPAPIIPIRKHFCGTTGKRAAMKKLVVETCECRGWKVEDDNEADALAQLDYAMHRLPPPQMSAA